MGIALWAASCATAIGLARIVPPRDAGRWWLDLLLATIAAAAAGLGATALDFGGWREPDWRAALFVFFSTFAVLGASRAATLLMARR